MAFHVVMKIPLLASTSQIKTVLQTASRERNDFPDEEIDKVCHKLDHPMGIKQLLITYEMAAESSKKGKISTIFKPLIFPEVSNSPWNTLAG